MKLSLCITTYNRPELTLKSFEKVYHDPRIDEIIIVDDHSEHNRVLELGISLDKKYKELGEKRKDKFFINPQNLGMSRNKKTTIELAENDWCILLDSDNQIDSSYIDAWENSGRLWNHYIYCPAGALPNFDYTKFNNYIFSRRFSIHHFQNDQAFNHLLNTCNYVVHRETYLKNYVYNPDIKAADTIWHTYNHLKNGGVLMVVKDMFYQHMVHNDSGWMKDRKENSKKFQEIKKMIMAL